MSKISLKTSQEIEIMKRSGKIAATVLGEISKKATIGSTGLELNKLAEEIIAQAGGVPSFKGYNGYPASICVSINSEVVHGIPSDEKFASGDIVGIDVGVCLDGYHSDTAITLSIGEVSGRAQKLIDVTKKSLENGLAEVKAGVHLGDVQSAIQATIESAGFSVVRDLTGHGVGRELQEAPSIPNYGQKGKGLILEEGMTLAIEPMSAMGDWHIGILDNNWTIVTTDESLSAHFEHTIAVTKNGYVILTK